MGFHLYLHHGLEHADYEIYKLENWFHQIGEKSLGYDEQEARAHNFVHHQFHDDQELGSEIKWNGRIEKSPLIQLAEHFFQRAHRPLDGKILQKRFGKSIYDDHAIQHHYDILEAAYKRLQPYFTGYIQPEMQEHMQVLNANINAAMKIVHGKARNIEEAGGNLEGYVPHKQPFWDAQIIRRARKLKLFAKHLLTHSQTRGLTGFSVSLLVDWPPLPKDLSAEGNEQLLILRNQLIEDITDEYRFAHPVRYYHGHMIEGHHTGTMEEVSDALRYSRRSIAHDMRRAVTMEKNNMQDNHHGSSAEAIQQIRTLMEAEGVPLYEASGIADAHRFAVFDAVHRAMEYAAKYIPDIYTEGASPALR